MKKIMLAAIIISGLMFGGCGTTTENSQQRIEQNVVTKEGVVQTKIGDEYVLKTDSELVNMTSNKVNLDDYMKKQVKVTGMFSGSTLYVDRVEEN